jgi:hypothetical protein
MSGTRASCGPRSAGCVASAPARLGARAASSWIEIVDDGRVSVRSFPEPALTRDRLLRGRNQVAHQSTMVVDRQYFVDVVGLFDEDIPRSYGEDYDWLLRAAEIEPVIVVPEPLVRVLWHESSWFYDRWDTIIDAYDHLTAKHPEMLDDRRGAAVVSGRLAYCYAALGRRREAVRQAALTLRRDPRQLRWLLSLPVIVRPGLAVPVISLVRRFGRSI